MASKKAARGSSYYARANGLGSGQTHSIVADRDTFRLAALSALFVMACLVVPTFMALLKNWGVW